MTQEANKLMRKARESAKWRGHKLLPFEQGSQHKNVYTAYCSICGHYIQVNTHPTPNEINISGSVVAVNCSKANERLTLQGRCPVCGGVWHNCQCDY